MPRFPDTAAPAVAVFPSFEPLGERCLLIRLGERIEPEVTRRVHTLTARLLAALPWDWAADAPADTERNASRDIAAAEIRAPDPAALRSITDVVPAFTTVALHYRPERLPRARGSAYAQLRDAVAPLLRDTARPDAATARLIDIPVCYGGEHGPDLDDVARQCGLAPADVVRLHGASPTTVHAFYFSPGNPFAGPLDARLSVPRRATPRTRVEAGSVAIANGLTSIYQVASPGGWNILGRTPWSLFDLTWAPPTRLRLGDRLRFTPISPETFAELDERRPR